MMKTPKPTEVTETDKSSEDWSLTGPNTELLSVRIPKGLYQELEALAKQSKRQLPEVVRELLWFHAFPLNVQGRIQELNRENAALPAEQAMAYYLSLLPQLKMYEHQVEKVIEACDRVKQIQENALALNAKLKALEAEASAEWQKFLDAST